MGHKKKHKKNTTGSMQPVPIPGGTETTQACWRWNDEQYQYVCSNCGYAPKDDNGYSMTLKTLAIKYPRCKGCGLRIRMFQLSDRDKQPEPVPGQLVVVQKNE